MHKYLHRAAPGRMFSKILMVISLVVLYVFLSWWIFLQVCIIFISGNARKLLFTQKKINHWRTLFYLVEGRGLNANVFSSLPVLLLNEWESLVGFLRLIDLSISTLIFILLSVLLLSPLYFNFLYSSELERDLHNYSTLVYDNSDISYWKRERDYSVKYIGMTEQLSRKNKIPYTKINSRWCKKYNIEILSLKIPRKKQEKLFVEYCSEKGLSNNTKKTESMKRKLISFTLKVLKMYTLEKNTIDKVKRQ